MTQTMGSPARLSSDPADEAAFQRAVAGARSGRAPAFEWLWHRFSRQVTAFARLQGSDDPEGLANDVFAAAFGRIGDFSGSATNFVSFVFAIARNKINDEHRRRGRRVMISNTEDGFRERLEASNPTHSAEAEALAGLVPETADALRRLTDEQREIIFLRLVADLPIEEVASLTGRSVGAVKAMQHRALVRMRREILRGAVSR